MSYIVLNPAAALHVCVSYLRPLSHSCLIAESSEPVHVHLHRARKGNPIVEQLISAPLEDSTRRSIKRTGRYRVAGVTNIWALEPGLANVLIYSHNS
jgi:hypothetical protein